MPKKRSRKYYDEDDLISLDESESDDDRRPVVLKRKHMFETKFCTCVVPLLVISILATILILNFYNCPEINPAAQRLKDSHLLAPTVPKEEASFERDHRIRPITKPGEFSKTTKNMQSGHASRAWNQKPLSGQQNVENSSEGPNQEPRKSSSGKMYDSNSNVKTSSKDLEKKKIIDKLSTSKVMASRKISEDHETISERNVGEKSTKRDIQKSKFKKQLQSDESFKQTLEKWEAMKKSSTASEPLVHKVSRPVKSNPTANLPINGYRVTHVLDKKPQKDHGQEFSLSQPYVFGTHKPYGSNVCEEWCIVYKATTSGLMASLKFNYFSLERGFDYLSIIESRENRELPPIYLTGSEPCILKNGECSDPTKREQIRKNGLNFFTEKDGYSRLCFFFHSDESRTDDGFSAELTIAEDPRKLSQWGKCYRNDIATLKNQPFYSGQCGIGSHQRKVQCPVDANCPAVDVDYCLDIPCGNRTVSDIPQLDGSEIPLKYAYDGTGRWDPTFPDVFSNYHSTNRKIDIDALLKLIADFRASFANHFTRKGLEYGYYPTSQEQKETGKRLIRSLLLGDTFKAVFTGSSRTSGAYNMFASSYPIQLQSLMRPFWVENGYDGAAFQSVNAAMDTEIGTEMHGPAIRALAGERADIVFWENEEEDSTFERIPENYMYLLEQSLRNTLRLESRPVWAYVTLNHCDGIVNPSSCPCKGSDLKDPKLLRKVRSAYRSRREDIHMWFFEPFNGASMECDKEGFQYLKTNGNPSPRGHRVIAEVIGYAFMTGAHRWLMKHAEELKAALGASTIPTEALIKLFQSDKPDLPEASFPVTGLSDSSFSLTSYHVSSDRSLDLFVNHAETTWKWVDNSAIFYKDQRLDLDFGGQAPIDQKGSWVSMGHKSRLTFSIKVLPGASKILVCNGTRDPHKCDDLSITINGKQQTVYTAREKMRSIIFHGCFIDKIAPAKYDVVITSKTDFTVAYVLSI